MSSYLSGDITRLDCITYIKDPHIKGHMIYEVYMLGHLGWIPGWTMELSLVPYCVETVDIGTVYVLCDDDPTHNSPLWVELWDCK